MNVTKSIKTNPDLIKKVQKSIDLIKNNGSRSKNWSNRTIFNLFQHFDQNMFILIKKDQKTVD